MVVGIIFSAESPEKSLWGDVQGIRNIITKWQADFYIVVDKEGIIPEWRDKAFESYRVTSYDEAIKCLKEVHPECKTTFFTTESNDLLHGHLHQKDECYIFGADSYHAEVESDYTVKIPCDFELWSVNCINIALYDRKVRL